MVNWNNYNPFRKTAWSYVPKVKVIRSLATVNLFVLSIRLVQIFFEGVVLGIMAYYIQLLNDANSSIPSSFTFLLVACVFAIITQFIYCFKYTHNLYFLWDFAIALGFLIGFFWLYDYVKDTLPCGWGAFNPFGSDRCAQTRSVLVICIILACLWLGTSIINAFSVWKKKRNGNVLVVGKEEV